MDEATPTRSVLDLTDPDPPPYEPPRVITYRGDEILRLLGPAQACSFGHSVVMCAQNFGPPNFDPPASGGQG
jgi:hypothetical protein